MASSPPEISSTLLGQNSTATRDDSRDNTNLRVSTNLEDNTPSPNETTNHTSTNNSNAGEEESHFQKKKRQKTSVVWLEFKEVELPDGSKKGECVHCKTRLSILQSKSTSHFSRHLQKCVRRMLYQKQQQRITLQVVDNESSGQVVTLALTDGKLDMMKMRESMAHLILMHEHPFTIVEEEGFNMLQKRGMLEWEKVSRNTIKKDCVQVYEIEKKRLKDLLKTVQKISVTTDLWKSTNQRIEYMVLTGHFIDSKWRLHKRVLSFVHLPPHRGVEIADNLYKCMKELKGFIGYKNRYMHSGINNKIKPPSSDLIYLQ